MALRTIITIWDTEGYEADRIRDDFATADYDNAALLRYSLTGSASQVEVDLGPVTTAKYIYVNSESAEITLFKNNSTECWTFTGPFLVKGCSVTALHIKSEADSNVSIYVAGD